MDQLRATIANQKRELLVLRRQVLDLSDLVQEFQAKQAVLIHINRQLNQCVNMDCRLNPPAGVKYRGLRDLPCDAGTQTTPD